MPLKRTPVFRSSSDIERGPTMLEHAIAAKPVQEMVEDLREVAPGPERSRCGILTLASPVMENQDDESEHKVLEGRVGERFGVFLDACSRCEKKLSMEEDVFMYGCLQAFCSPECRDKHIALDEKDTIISGNQNYTDQAKLIEAAARPGFENCRE